MPTARPWQAPWKTEKNYKEIRMEQILSNPVVAGVAALVVVYLIFKVLGVLSFLFRLGIAVVIAAAVFQYFSK